MKTRLDPFGKPNQPDSLGGGRGGCGPSFRSSEKIRINRLHHIAGKDLAAPDGGENIVDAGARQPRQSGFQLVFGEGLAGALEGPHHDLPPEPRILGAHGIARGAAG